jgi:PQQ-dependent catabolism-associated beta-propeller protein
MTVSRLAIALLLSLALSTQTNARGTGYVFVSNEQTNTVAVIDSRHEDQVIKWIKTSRRPRGMVFRDDRKQLLVACGKDNVIDVIDVATLAVIDHIPTGTNPEVFELSHDQNRLYISNSEKSAVQEIGLGDRFIGREIPTGAEPGSIVESSDGKTLYVTSQMSNWVHVVEVATGAVTDNIVVGTRPRQLLLIPGGKELWVSNEWSGQVSIIDRANNHVTGNIDFRPPGSRQIDVTPLGLTATKDGETAIVALGRADFVAFVDTVRGTIQHYVPVGRGPRGVALGAGEHTLYVTNEFSDDVSIVNVTSHKAIKAVHVGGAPYSVRADDLLVGPFISTMRDHSSASSSARWPLN